MVFTMRDKLSLRTPAGTTIAATLTRTQAHSQTQPPMCKQAGTRTHARTHTNAPTHTRTHTNARTGLFRLRVSRCREGEIGRKFSPLSSLAFVAVVLVCCRHQDLLASHSVTVADFGASFKTRKSGKKKVFKLTFVEGGIFSRSPTHPTPLQHPLCSHF